MKIGANIRLRFHVSEEMGSKITEFIEKNVSQVSILYISEDNFIKEDKNEAYVILNSTEDKGFQRTIVAEYDNKIIAIANASLIVDTNEIKQNFEIEDFIFVDQHSSSDHAILNFLLISPYYENKRRFLLKEIFRVLGRSCLYYKWHSDIEHDISTILHEFICVQPRRK